MSKRKRVRYAVVGLGWFGQEAILPAFSKAKNAELVALVSGDEAKLAELAERYGTPHAVGYDGYDALLASGEVDAVYIALPNTQHRDYTVRAARAGVHVLCEKPMAMDEDECVAMIDACHDARVKLMVAYRLHFEPANLRAIEAITSGEIGEPRLFSSTFTMQVEPGNSRLRADLNAGPLYDLGVYCINASRYLFRDEPREVMAFAGRAPEDERFAEVEEHVAALLKFPGDRLATFAASFGAHEHNRLEVLGTKGRLVLEPAFSHSAKLKLSVESESGSRSKAFASKEQISPEITYFADCILHDREPEPSGEEGLADARVIRAIHESLLSGSSAKVAPVHKEDRPDASQERPSRTKGPEPNLVNAEAPH
jgi:predicted dehydrogenase